MSLRAGWVLLSPWCDLTVSAPSYTVNASTDPLFSAASATEAAALYLQGWDAHDPLVSPGTRPDYPVPLDTDLRFHR